MCIDEGWTRGRRRAALQPTSHDPLCKACACLRTAVQQNPSCSPFAGFACCFCFCLLADAGVAAAAPAAAGCGCNADGTASTPQPSSSTSSYNRALRLLVVAAGCLALLPGSGPLPAAANTAVRLLQPASNERAAVPRSCSHAYNSDAFGVRDGRYS